MYIPKPFEITDQAEIRAFIREMGLGALISTRPSLEPAITHVPFVLRDTPESFVLETHLARENDHLDLLKSGRMCTVLFQGPNTYISSSVYAHHNVPTWNYQAVHVHGTVTELEPEELEAHLKESVSGFEAHRHHKLSYEDFDRKMLDAYLPLIRGIRVEPYKIEAKYKLSQNRNEQDYEAIVADLKQSTRLPDQAVGEVMQQLKHKK